MRERERKICMKINAYVNRSNLFESIPPHLYRTKLLVQLLIYLPKKQQTLNVVGNYPII